MPVSLMPLSRENVRAVCELRLAEDENGTPHLVRFMVDADHQGRGIGGRAVELLVDELRAGGWKTLETSVVPVFVRPL